MKHLPVASVVFLGLCLSCEVGPQGSTGPAGPAGPAGAGSSPGSSPDCPEGYTRDVTQINIVLCRQGMDEVVKVGVKGSAFWIDRYESSMWQNPDGTGTQYGVNADDYPTGFSKNGQISIPVYALSRAGVKPSAYVNWFQSNEACRASGKRLPTSEEWLTAARGTIDPGVSDGSGGTCVTMASGPRMTGTGNKCVSDWGAQDMIGSLYETMAEWYAAPSKQELAAFGQPWPPGWGNDQVANVLPTTLYTLGGSTVTGPLPAALTRGGRFNSGTDAGIFSFVLTATPALGDVSAGQRCIIPR